MAFIKGVFGAYPRNYITKDELMKLFEHKSFNYSQEKLQTIKKILSSMNVQGRPTCVNFKQFWEDLDEVKCPCTIERPSTDNLFRAAEDPFNPTMGERAVIWEAAVKVGGIVSVDLFTKNLTICSFIKKFITFLNKDVCFKTPCIYLETSLPL